MTTHRAAAALNTPLAFLKRDFLIAASYKTAFAADVLGIAFKVTTFYYIGAVFGDGANPSLASAGDDYFAFLLVGIALLDFVHTSLQTFSQSVRESQTTGTLEVVLLSPIRLPDMVLFSSLWPYAFTALRFATYILMGTVLFGLPVAVEGMPAAGLVLLLTILCFAPLGIISAAIIMVFKKGAWFPMLVNGVSFLLAGVAYPVEVLPAWAARVGYYLPLTHSVNGMREALLMGKGIVELRGELLFMMAFAAAFLPVSLWIFELAVNRTKRLGTLTQY